MDARTARIRQRLILQLVRLTLIDAVPFFLMMMMMMMMMMTMPTYANFTLL